MENLFYQYIHLRRSSGFYHVAPWVLMIHHWTKFLEWLALSFYLWFEKVLPDISFYKSSKYYSVLAIHTYYTCTYYAAATAESLQSCLTLCDPIDGSPPSSSVPGILQARILEWVAISFSNAWKWKWSHSVVSDSSRPHGLQPTKLLRPWDFPGKSTGVRCHHLLRHSC